MTQSSIKGKIFSFLPRLSVIASVGYNSTWIYWLHSAINLPEETKYFCSSTHFLLKISYFLCFFTVAKTILLFNFAKDSKRSADMTFFIWLIKAVSSVLVSYSLTSYIDSQSSLAERDNSQCLASVSLLDTFARWETTYLDFVLYVLLSIPVLLSLMMLKEIVKGRSYVN